MQISSFITKINNHSRTFLVLNNLLIIHRKTANNCRAQSNMCQVAVCQFTATNSKDNNLKIVKNLINNAVQQDAKMVFLPEACDFIGTSKEEARVLAEPLTGPIMTEYKKTAKENNIWLSVGGFHEKISEASMYNSHVLINNQGEISSVYRKIHLFDVSIPEKNILLQESELTTGGREILCPTNTPAGCLALAICYDLRFPEMSTLQRKLGTDMLTYPSAFTNVTGQAHWEILLRARAVENQCYVVAAAQYGKHNAKRTSYGQSMIVDPWGKILAECPKFSPDCPTNESVAVASIDIKELNRIRQEMPVIKHRRNDLYNLSYIGDKSPIQQINDCDSYKFADKTIPGTTVFYRTQYSFAFTNIRCVVPGHVLISSLRHAKRMEDLNEEEVSDLFVTAIKVQKVMEKVQNATSSTLCVQDGEFAGQTVPHVHIHILPRKEGDFQRNDDVYDCLSRHDRDDSDVPIRTTEEMSEEAKILRKYFYS